MASTRAYGVRPRPVKVMDAITKPGNSPVSGRRGPTDLLPPTAAGRPHKGHVPPARELNDGAIVDRMTGSE